MMELIYVEKKVLPISWQAKYVQNLFYLQELRLAESIKSYYYYYPLTNLIKL